MLVSIATQDRLSKNRYVNLMIRSRILKMLPIIMETQDKRVACMILEVAIIVKQEHTVLSNRVVTVPLIPQTVMLVITAQNL